VGPPGPVRSGATTKRLTAVVPLSVVWCPIDPHPCCCGGEEKARGGRAGRPINPPPFGQQPPDTNPRVDECFGTSKAKDHLEVAYASTGFALTEVQV